MVWDFSTWFSVLFLTSLSRKIAIGSRKSQSKHFWFAFPYTQLLFCNRSTSYTSLWYTAQLSISTLQYWFCHIKTCKWCWATQYVCTMWWLNLFKEKLYRLLKTSSHNVANTDLLLTVNFLIFCFNTRPGDKGRSYCLGPPLLTLAKKEDNSVPHKFAKECQRNHVLLHQFPVQGYFFL